MVGCKPANQELRAHERRREADGSLRVVYAASIRSCLPCPLREQCQWNGSATAKPRQVSVLLGCVAKTRKKKTERERPSSIFLDNHSKEFVWISHIVRQPGS
jgi:hypothetical protein